MSRRSCTLFAVALLCTSSFALGEVGDPTIETDHPHYPGEGAFQTPEACVKWATRDAKTNQDRALALFNWLLTHQWHLASPQEWNLPGVMPGQRPNDTEMVVYDANRGRFSYGYGLCGTVHAWNEPYWKALGMPARRRAFPGHTNSEVFYDEKWHAFDTDMAGIVFNRDGSIAGYAEIARDLKLLDLPQGSWPRYPFAWPSDFEAMKAGWKQIAAGGHWYNMYASGYAAHPGIVHLRKGETFTRYYDPDTFGGPSKRRFWHRQPGGPNRLWTFANGGTPFHQGDKSNCRGQTTFGNAVFEFSPDLTSTAYQEGLAAADNETPSPSGLTAIEGKPTYVVFEHFSPYVICGDPVDDEDPMQHKATDGLVVEGHAFGELHGEISADQGQTWTAFDATLPASNSRDSKIPDDKGSKNSTNSPASQSIPFRWDLTEQVKGRYGWQIKLSWTGSSKLRDLKFSTTCQMSQAIYPRLKPDGSTVTFRTTGKSVVPIVPRMEQEAATVNVFEERSLRSPNLDFVGRSPDQRAAYTIRGPKPASVVFRVNSATRLTAVSAAARFSARSPSPPGTEFGLSWSTDQGKTWQRFASIALPEDNEFSSGWVSGQTPDLPGDVRSALVRVELNGGGRSASLLALELYGIRQTASPRASPVTVTYGWSEGQKDLEHTFTIPAGTLTATSQVPTGKTIRDRFIRISN